VREKKARDRQNRTAARKRNRARHPSAERKVLLTEDDRTRKDGKGKNAWKGAPGRRNRDHAPPTNTGTERSTLVGRDSAVFGKSKLAVEAAPILLPPFPVT
jgi:hypothetical protein